MATVTILLGEALPATAALLIVAVVAWPHRRVQLHRISNFFFLRRIRAQQSRSRTPGGSANAGSAVPRQLLPARAGCESPDADRFEAPPAHPSLPDTASHHPGTAVSGRPPTPVGAGVSRGLASTGPTLAGADEALFDHTAPARPHTPVGTVHPHLPSVPTGPYLTK
jgi:hypothetical protein